MGLGKETESSLVKFFGKPATSKENGCKCFEFSWGFPDNGDFTDYKLTIVPDISFAYWEVRRAGELLGITPVRDMSEMTIGSNEIGNFVQFVGLSNDGHIISERLYAPVDVVFSS